AAPAAEPRGGRHNELEPHVISVNLAHLAAQVREPVDQTKLGCLLPAPELAVEQHVAGLLDLCAATRPDEIDEGAMHVALDRLDARDVVGLLGEEDIEGVLACPCSIDPAVHPNLVDQLV